MVSIPLARRNLLVFLPSLTLLFGVTPVHAHGRGLGDSAPAPVARGSAEAKLQAFETQALGSQHAAAHARTRMLARRPRRDGSGAVPARPRAAAARAVGVTEGGSWDAARPLPVIAINAVMLPTGKVLMFAYPARPGYGESDRAKAFVWDPVSGASKRVDPPIDPATGKPTNIWCGGASLLPDGRVLVTGGNVDDPATDFHGIDAVFTFNPFTEQWDPPATNASMAQGRWYPSQVLMPDGRTLIAGGLTRPGDPDFGVGNNADNDLELISPDGTIERRPGFFNGAGGPPLSGLYPRMFWMPSGRALAAGPFATDTWSLTPSSPGAPTASTEIPNLSADREWGTAVLLPRGRVITLGGSRPDAADASGVDGRRQAQSTTEVFDENAPGAGWQAATPMAVGRSHANSVLLPDGKVATVGGGYGEDSGQEFYRWLYSEDHKRVELFDPATNSTVLGNAQSEARTYHSSALLLPDGRVMSAGDDINGPGGAETGTTYDTAEIYSPPYLFRGPRPVIDEVPLSMQAGAEVEIVASGATATEAVLVAPGAATHATDMSQRLVPLAAPQPRPGGRLALTLPSDADLAPPGYYMLFLLSAEGVPSVSRFVRVVAAPAPAQPPAPPPAAPADGAGPTLTLKLSLKLAGRLPRLRTLRRTKRFTITVEASEPGRVRLSALLEHGGKPGRSVAPERTVVLTAGARRRVSFRLTRTGLRLLAHRRRAVVRIRAAGVFESGRALPAVQVRRTLR